MSSSKDHSTSSVIENKDPSLQNASLENAVPWSDEVLSQWLARDPAAASIDRWIEWNNSPLRHIPQETVVSFFPSSFCTLFLEDARTSHHVDFLLRSKLSWSMPVSWSPQDPLWELAMIAPDRFKRLAFLGVSFSMQRDLAKIIDGALVRELRKKIGEDIFQFVLLSGASLKYSLEPLQAALSGLPSLMEALDQGAVMLVEQAFSSKERGIQERIATKLPGCFAHGFHETPLPWSAEAEKMLSMLWKEAASWL